MVTSPSPSLRHPGTHFTLPCCAFCRQPRVLMWWLWMLTGSKGCQMSGCLKTLTVSSLLQGILFASPRALLPFLRPPSTPSPVYLPNTFPARLSPPALSFNPLALSRPSLAPLSPPFAAIGGSKLSCRPFSHHVYSIS